MVSTNVCVYQPSSKYTFTDTMKRLRRPSRSPGSAIIFRLEVLLCKPNKICRSGAGKIREVSRRLQPSWRKYRAAQQFNDDHAFSDDELRAGPQVRMGVQLESIWTFIWR